MRTPLRGIGPPGDNVNPSPERSSRAAIRDLHGKVGRDPEGHAQNVDHPQDLVSQSVTHDMLDKKSHSGVQTLRNP